MAATIQVFKKPEFVSKVEHLRREYRAPKTIRQKI